MTKKKEKPGVKQEPPVLEVGERGTPDKSPLAAESAAEADSDVHAKLGFPIVGIGASAGGPAVFEAFFSGMPADTESGMAFVLVQHLAPDHKSILADLIKRDTRMQVFEIQDGMKVQPDCAYIIPPHLTRRRRSDAHRFRERKQELCRRQRALFEFSRSITTETVRMRLASYWRDSATKCT